MEIAIVFYIIIAGVIIYVAGEIIVKLVIDPVQELKRVIADIAFKLIHYSHVYRMPAIVWYRFTQLPSCCFFYPEKQILLRPEMNY